MIEANLSRANLTGADLKFTDLTGADLTGANLTGANLSGAILIEANLSDADLSNVILESESEINSSIIDRAIFCNTTMPDGTIANDPERVMEAEELLRRYQAGEREFEGIVLSRAQLRGANLSGIILRYAYFPYADLRKANLSGANLDQVNFNLADLRDVNLSEADMGGAKLVRADLRRSHFWCTELGGVEFTETNLKDARVFFSQEANFYKTILPNGDVIEGFNYYPWTRRPGDFTNCLQGQN